MQLKSKFFILIYLLIFVSCQNNNEEEYKVIATIYNSIPKELLPPPKPTGKNEVLDSIVNKIDYDNLNPLIFNYAINENFINFEIDNISKKFKSYNSKELFKTININEDEFVLIESLKTQNYSKKLDKKKVTKLCEDDIVFSSKQFLKKNSKEKDSLDGIISFSRVSFNKGYEKAAVCVGVYRSGLDSNLKLYILEKNNGKWEIKSYKLLSIS
ncbi:hypothetical protein N7U66_10525 [Lacinutrix neustonica]|uniref:Lipoprotein n=1 Tax=Lacinutrix neustonica TaxID=2980107 RepID=A0A9E8MYP2_9FLAO|nr:hypothetical protein [Lacinutrix neustonica]WAC03806.1 hypothetical protein N7U66_10525 [Lacinutrix neustonica]